MHDFKAIFKVMNKHYGLKTMKECRLWNSNNIIMLQLQSLRKCNLESTGMSYLENLNRNFMTRQDFKNGIFNILIILTIIYLISGNLCVMQ